MDYFSTFAISRSGMDVAKTMLDVTAVNLANMNSARKADGTPYKPLQVSTAAAGPSFATGFEQLSRLRGAQVTAITESDAAPKLVYDPGNPDADNKGYVSLPAVNHLTEMSNMNNALRAYQANVMAMKTAITMATKALEIGGAN